MNPDSAEDYVRLYDRDALVRCMLDHLDAEVTGPRERAERLQAIGIELVGLGYSMIDAVQACMRVSTERLRAALRQRGARP